MSNHLVEPDTAGLTPAMTYMLAALLMLLMIGLGSTLTMGQVYRVMKHPKGIFVGWMSQFGWMPLIAMCCCLAFGWNDSQGRVLADANNQLANTTLYKEYVQLKHIYSQTGNSNHLRYNVSCKCSYVLNMKKSGLERAGEKCAHGLRCLLCFLG